MLITFGRYANLNGYIKTQGDLFVDTHHTIEDTAIALGKTLKMMIKDTSINRYANAIIPMDEALVRTVIDMGGRAYLDFDYEFKREKIRSLRYGYDS
jgi:Imidazoleglycerol-phosphate dehydratase